METIKSVVLGLKAARRRLASLGAATLLLTSTFVISIDGIVGVRIASASTQAGMRDTTFPTNLPSWITNGLVVASNGNIFVARNVGFVRYTAAGALTDVQGSGDFASVALQNIGGTEYVIAGGPGTSPTAQLMRYTTGGVRDTTFTAGQTNRHRALSVSAVTNKIFAGVATSNTLIRYSENGASEASVAPGGEINAVKVYSAGGTEYVLVGGAFGMKRYVAGTLVDSGFAANPGATVNAIEVQPDGKILVGGTFGLRRYLATGEIDSEFASVSGTVTAVAVQSDGKILAGGQFNTYNNVTFNRIIRLTSTGTQDNTFLSSSGFNNTVRDIKLQSDGKMIIGGQFTTYSGSAFNRIMRLGTSGSIDTTFVSSSGADGTVHNIRLQSDEKMVLGGAFTTYSGSSVNRIVRLGTSGSIDTTFNIGTGLNGTANALAIQSDGKFIAGGSFTTYSGSSSTRIVRINTNGTRDTTFNVGTGFDNIVNSLTILPNGKIAAGGFFTSYSGSTLVNKIAILNISGTLDTTFVQNTSSFNGTSVGFNSTVNLVLPITI